MVNFHPTLKLKSWVPRNFAFLRKPQVPHVLLRKPQSTHSENHKNNKNPMWDSENHKSTPF